MHLYIKTLDQSYILNVAHLDSASIQELLNARPSHGDFLSQRNLENA